MLPRSLTNYSIPLLETVNAILLYMNGTVFDPILILAVLTFSTLAGFIVVLSGRYSGAAFLLYSYIKNKYSKEYGNLLTKDGKILTVVSEGSAMITTEIGLLKSRIGYQFRALKQIASINPNDQELQRQVTSMQSTLRIALNLLYGALAIFLLTLIFLYGYVNV